MVTVNKCSTIKRRGAMLLSIAATGLLCGCSTIWSSANTNQRTAISQPPSSMSASLQQPTPPGIVNYVWEEPMVNVVEVPPGLDPEGIYYRPAHQEVVEVRQGRWKYYKDK